MRMRIEKPKLLIVDDEMDICTHAQNYFGRRGFIVSTTGSGLEALSMIKASRPDLVLLDLTLDDLDGKEVLERLRKEDKETKIIVISGQENLTDIDKLYSLGISGYYVKPITLENQAKLVYDALGLRQLEKTVPQANKVSKYKIPKAGIIHQLSNKLSIIRGNCEGFVLDYQDGLYKDKTSDELLKMSIEIMKNVQHGVDGAMEMVDKIKKE
ncbi:MAG: response regulator [Candidatus Omnitrophica bacterium]|nr:response regulator [Candidatus Omnitrophota bacterium]